MTARRFAKTSALSATQRKHLAEILAAEIAGAPITYTRYRRSLQMIKRLDDLSDRRLIQHEELSYIVTFLGLIATRNRIAQALLRDCEKLFMAIRKHYRLHQQAIFTYTEIERQLALPAGRGELVARFLRRSTLSLGTCTEPHRAGIVAHESCLEIPSFRRLKELARERLGPPRRPHPEAPLTLLEPQLTQLAGTHVLLLGNDAVGAAWRKMHSRISHDLGGAITAARSLVENVCRQILDERHIAHTPDDDLPRLYKATAAQLQLAPTPHHEKAVRQILGNATGVVEGIAFLRNKLGDSHGQGSAAAPPARRHAELTVLLAAAISSFLLATSDAQRPL